MPGTPKSSANLYAEVAANWPSGGPGITAVDARTTLDDIIASYPNTVDGGSGIVVGVTAIAGGVSGRVLYDNGGVVGETTSGGPTQVVITAGATYTVAANVGRVLVNKISGSATAITLPLASSMTAQLASGVLIKDVKGDADVNNITINFTGGEKCDGASSLTIGTKYDFTTVNPLPGGGGWYAS